MAAPVRLIAAIVIGTGLAVVLGAQALSSVSVRSSPALAAQIFPLNGHALAKVAYGKFLDEVNARLGRSAAPSQEAGEQGMDPQPQGNADQELLQDAASARVNGARDAIRREPLLPRAHALLIMAEQDAGIRRSLLENASLLDRRDLVLRGLALEQHIADEDYEATIAAVDELLRVNPERSATFFPILTEALGYADTVPVFERLLVDTLPWRPAFLNAAVGNARARVNLATLRQRMDLADENFDRRLIAGLVAQGEVAMAEELYTSLDEPADDGGVVPGDGAWPTQYPPFDWRLADDAGLRAQVSRDGKRLEISVRPGRGGVLAERLVRTPPVPFQITFANDIEPVRQISDVKLRVGCLGQPGLVSEQSLATGRNRLIVESVPSDCTYVALSIFARSWSGMSALRGTVSGVEIRPAGR